MSRNRFAHIVLLYAAIVVGARPSPALGQSSAQLVHRVWTMEDGLPISHLNQVIQTRDGYLWLASFEGIIRFDGAQFTVFSTATNPELPTNRFGDIAEAPDGSLWALAEYDYVVRWMGRAGFQVYGPVSDRPGAALSSLHFGDDGSLLVRGTRGVFVLQDDRFVEVAPQVIGGLPITAVYRDRADALWVGTDGLGAFRLSSEGSQQIIVRDPPLTKLVTAFAEDAAGTMYLATGTGVFAYGDGAMERVEADDLFRVNALISLGGDSILVVGDPGLFSLHAGRIVPRRADIIPPARGVVSLVDGQDTRWLALGGNLYRNETQVHATRLGIQGMATDREGNLWVAADGLHRFGPGVFSVYGTPEGGIDNVYSIMEDANGAVWFGSFSGELSVYRDGRIRRLQGGPTMVQSTAVDRTGTMWVGMGSYGGCILDGERCLPGSRFLGRHDVKSIFEDSRGTIWFGTNRGLYRRSREGEIRYSTDDGLSHDFVRVIHEASDGSLWFGTNGGGLTRYIGGRFDRLTMAEGLSSNLVRAIHEDESGALWIGTEDRGLNRIGNPGVPGDSTGALTDAEVVVIRRSDGLFDDGVHAILDDRLGRFWMSTNRGIFWVTRSQLDDFVAGQIEVVHSSAYGEQDGLRNREANGGVQSPAIVASDGRLWFATQAGAAVVDPASIDNDDLPLPVIVEHVRTGGSSAPVHLFGDDLADVYLAASQRDFEVGYTALSFRAPDRIRFRYRLEGFQDRWVDVANRRTAFFTNVPPGAYKFRLQARLDAGEWTETNAPVPINIAPFYYETLPFRGAMVLLVIGLAAAGVRVRRGADERGRRKLTRLVGERTALLAEEQRESISQRERAEKALEVVQSQAERLQRIDAAKTRLFANLSHEFRTPLTLTIGPLEDLRDGLHGPVSDEAEGELERALRNARRMLRMVNQILDVAKLEAGEMQLQAREADIGLHVRDIADAFLPLAERSGIVFTVETPPEPLLAYIDPDLMEKVTSNLLSNAFKFTPTKGRIRVTVRSVDGSAEIEVKDSGPGIPSGQRDMVFERFHQVNESQRTFQPGTGIGLSLVRELVDLHRGHIRVDSEEGFGSSFTVSIPLGSEHLTESEIGVPESVRPHDAAHSEVDALAEPIVEVPDDTLADAPDRTTVLVVDDNAEVRAFVRKHLSKDYAVLEADNGREALAMVTDREPDLVVSDVMMPEMDGMEFLKALRSNPAVDFIPVILLTARATNEAMLQGFAHGADEFLTKPFSVSELRARVDNLIASRRRLRQRFARLPLAAGPGAEDPLLGRIREIVADHIGDEEFGVAQLSEAMGMSRSHLYRRLQSISGQSPADVLRTIRLEHAAGWLRDAAGNVSEVAYAAGFKSLAHFSRSFRQMFGVPPSEFARSARAEADATHRGQAQALG